MVTPEFVHDALRTGEAPIDMAPHAPHGASGTGGRVQLCCRATGFLLVASASGAGGRCLASRRGADADGFEWGQRIIERLKAGGNARCDASGYGSCLGRVLWHLQLWRADERRACGDLAQGAEGALPQAPARGTSRRRLATEGKMVGPKREVELVRMGRPAGRVSAMVCALACRWRAAGRHGAAAATSHWCVRVHAIY